MSTREERKLAAAERRRQYRIRWVDIGKKTVFPMKAVLTAISDDAATLIKQTPSLRSEIELALDEFIGLLAQVTAQTIKENQRKPATPPDGGTEKPL